LINKDDKNEKLIYLIIKNNNLVYFNSNTFNILGQKNEIDNHIIFEQKVEDIIVRKKIDFYFKGINKIPRNSLNNKCLFNYTKFNKYF
jgi:hypothetical protein